MPGSDQAPEPPKRLPVHLCPYCRAHVDEHDQPGLVECSKKWREQISGSPTAGQGV